MTRQPLISVAQARSELKEVSNDARDDAIILEALRVLTERIELKFGYGFVPTIGTRYRDGVGFHIDDSRQTLYLGAPLLALTSVTAGTTALTLWDGTPVNRATSQVYGYPLNQYPYWELRLLPNAAGLWRTTVDGDWIDAITVAGIWGFHRDYARAWLSSGDTVQNNPLSSSSTSLTVSNAAGADTLGRVPRFSPGNLLRIGTEFLPVNAVNLNTLTVERGALGSTAAAHNQNVAIEIWQADGAIQRAAMRWVSYIYIRRGQFQTATYDGVQTVQFPPDIPEEVNAILNELTPKRLYSV